MQFEERGGKESGIILNVHCEENAAFFFLSLFLSLLHHLDCFFEKKKITNGGHRRQPSRVMPCEALEV